MARKLNSIHPGEILREEFMAQFWMSLQANYDLQCAEDAAGKDIAAIRPAPGLAV
ncbi:hypothetical protein [Arenimonas sp. SCN 70-307]|uniref:hypothetical protein n=1 Tax=Arenimonas sp. SCN 70-307 TaxID=1660089 RepID=UPI000A61EDC9|nr:hypothetical protein [Arenimonas sp. SCN 70-307]